MNCRWHRIVYILVGIALLFPFLQDSLTAGTLDDLDKPFRPKADQHGILSLPADQAGLQGERLKLSVDRQTVEDWVHPQDRVVWEFLLQESGRYIVLVEYAAPSGRDGSLFAVEIAEQSRQGYVHATGRADRFLPQPLLKAVELEAGANRLVIRAIDVPKGFVMNLRRVRLVPAAGG